MAQPPLLSLEGMALQQGGKWLFGGPDHDPLDLHIGPRDRLALIGRNGVGKTTLFRMIDGQIETDAGTRKIKPHAKIVLLEQDPDLTGHATLMEWALDGSHAPQEHEVEAIAGQLGIDMTRETKGASGGEKRRAAIARALAQDPDLLLMDEPTNHLDLSAIDWLEGWLDRYKGAFVVISHDRTFLKRLTRATIWLDRGELRRKEVGFGGYEGLGRTGLCRRSARGREAGRQAEDRSALAGARRHRAAQAQPGAARKTPPDARAAGLDDFGRRHGQAEAGDGGGLQVQVGHRRRQDQQDLR